ncbi:NAD(P)-binding protein [Dendrothele bispora CBS 962.96]|uniref:D-xylose 1-dehydrogenase (NADP(+), D-xylono-1,5-lactone-forming) n=1 Tax=Dendrothele bispora (strain CBS 962.96) TaxID=1314807 RepID=A0A4S8MX30_DENBC|nr:NAD(P)-binding protein [Dendrothele bispora CBS 962.96]
MGETNPLVFRWGIISTGKIATAFTKDMLVDPKTRDVHDVIHKVTAVGSRNMSSVQNFIDTLFDDKVSKPKAYGSYEEVYVDPEVDAVYIGTPHTSHYINALDAIKAKKHVLCEKPVTTNAAELRSLIQAAKESNVFFMEAMWTRFQPLVLEVKKIGESGELGRPVVLHADLSGNYDIENIPTTHRILDPYLGGGALLDIGPYPLVWAIIALYEHPLNESTIPAVTGSMLKTPITGVDCNTCFTLNFFQSKIAAQAVLSCSINVDSADPGVTIRYEKGVVRIKTPIFCPKEFEVEYTDRGKVVRSTKRKFEYVGGGWHFQADEVARCVRDGKIVSDSWGHVKSLLEMDIFDEVRRQCSYMFPPGVEKVILATE